MGDGENLFTIDPDAAQRRRLRPRRIGPAFFFQTPNICGLTAVSPPLTMYMKKQSRFAVSCASIRQPPSGVRSKVARARIFARPAPYLKTGVSLELKPETAPSNSNIPALPCPQSG